MANLKDINYGIGKYLEASDASDIPDIGTNRKNLDLLNFKVATNNAYALYNFKDGMIDAYQTEGGVDTGGSSSTTTYDSADKYFWGRTPSITATGGTITTVGDYTFHHFTSSGDFITDTSQSIDWLLIGGGGAGGRHSGGGGGAGGLVYQAGRTIAAGTHDYVHGTGGATKTTDGVGADGNSSTWDISGVTMTAQGGGGGGYHATTGEPGGSGGGGSRGLGPGGSGQQAGQPGDSGTYGFSYPGGAGNTGTNPWPAGGGGGAGGAGSGTSGGNSGPGGAGKEIAIFSAFGVGGFFAGGGGGQTQDTDTHGTGGSGGGGDGGAGTPSPAADGAGRNGVDYTGSGGGGSS
ncbi:uncharacterized protein METZ01_LOCUS265473, partial [marine metagenome]